MNFLKQISLFVFITLFCTTPKIVYAVSEKKSTCAQIGSGLVAGAIAGVISHLAENRPLMTTLISLGACGFSWLILHHYLSRLTPKSRMDAAIEIMKLVKADSFLSQNFTTMDECITYINSHFRSNDLLAEARRRFEELLNCCEEALSLARQALQDTGEKNMKIMCELFIERTSDLVQALKIKLSWVACREVEVNLCKIEKDKIFLHDFATGEDAIDYVTNSFGADYPLVLAYNYAIDLKKKLENSLQILEHEVVENNLPGMAVKSKELEAKIQLLLNALANKISVISTHKDYKFHALSYENKFLSQQLGRLQNQCSSLTAEISHLQSQLSNLRLSQEYQRPRFYQSYRISNNSDLIYGSDGSVGVANRIGNN